MEKETVFLNFIPEDRPFAERISEQLKQSGIRAILPEDIFTLSDSQRVISGMESVVENSGVMVLILGKESVSDSYFISNTQYFCELAGKRQALVFCKKSDVPSNNAIALFYPRGVTVNTSNNIDKSLQKIIINIKRLLGMKVPPTIIPRQLNKRKVIRASLIIAILALITGLGYYFINRYKDNQAAIEAYKQIMQAPVIINKPFISESIEQGLIVTERNDNNRLIDEKTASEAPFHFTPEYIHKTLNFDDPNFDGTVNKIDLTPRFLEINEEPFQMIKQESGALQISSFVSESDMLYPHADLNYLFTLEKTSYIGIRFRINDYDGWNDYALQTLGFIETNRFPFAILNISTQQLISFDETNKPVFLGSDWHTIEMIINSKQETNKIYLDGKLLTTNHDLPSTNQILNLGLGMDCYYTTDWIGWSIDEIIFGGDEPLNNTSTPDKAVYHFNPEDILYYNNFEDTSIKQYDTNNNSQYSISDGKVDIHFSNNNPTHIPINFEIPTNPISDTNYYAIKYRITQTTDNYWTYNGQIMLSLWNQRMDDNQEARLWISKNTNNGESTIFNGQGIFGYIRDSREIDQQTNWHTIEMLLIPGSSKENDYWIQFWHDNLLISEAKINNPELFLESHSPYVINFIITTAENMSDPMEIELDEIIAGFVPDIRQGE